MVQVFEQSIDISANATTVERCITDRALMHQWLNPALRCEPLGERWNTDPGGPDPFHHPSAPVATRPDQHRGRAPTGAGGVGFRGLFFKAAIAGNVCPPPTAPIYLTALSSPSPIPSWPTDSRPLPPSGPSETWRPNLSGCNRWQNGNSPGRWGDGEMGRWGDGEMGRWGDGEMGS
jgi:hypothetical protein